MAVSYDKLLHLLIDRQMSNLNSLKRQVSPECNDADQTQEIHLA